jgi:hypothetical protein
MDANPIGLVVIAIAALVAAIVICTIKFKGFRDFWKAAWKDIKTAAVDAWHFIDNDMIHPLMSGIDKLVSFVKGHWKLLATIIATVLLGPVGGLVVFIATHWQQIRSLTGRLVSDVVHFFQQLPGRAVSAVSSLPGRIMGVLGSLAGRMFSFGAHIISSLASGIMSAAGDVVSAISNVAGDILDHIPHSPAKRGPLSGAGDPRLGGRKITALLASGMLDNRGLVANASARVAGAASVTTAAGRAGAGAGGPLQIEWVGGGADAEFITWLKKNIRIRGGNPNVLGR